MSNKFRALELYREHWYDNWVFDDPSLGLIREPFISGTTDLINAYADMDDRCMILFSDTPFCSPYSGPMLRLHSPITDGNETWYTCGEKVAYLCPNFRRYFPGEHVPPMLFVQVVSG